MLYSRGHIDIFLYELSRVTIDVACDIGFYLIGRPNGTEYNHFPSSKKLVEHLESPDAKSEFREYDFYRILIPEKERGTSSEEERKKIENKKNSLIFMLKTIKYCNSNELEKLRNSLIDISRRAGSIATC